MSWRVDLFAAMARRLRDEFAVEFAAPPRVIEDGEPVGLVPAAQVWGTRRTHLRVPDELPRSMFGLEKRLGLRILGGALRFAPPNQRHSRLGRPVEARRLTEVVGGHPPIEAWPDLVSDRGFARLLTHGPLAVAVAAAGEGEELLVDLSIFRGLPRHPALEPIGCKVAVRLVEGEPVPAWVELEDGRRVAPGERAWPRSRLIAACGLHTWVVIVGHLMNVHQLVAGPVAAVVHNHLPSSHPLRPLLEPHVLGSVVATHRANHSLLGRHGSVQAGYTFSHEGLSELLDRCIASFDLAHHDLPRALDQRGLLPWVEQGLFPYGEDAMSLWAAIDAYVDAYLRVYYPDPGAFAADRILHEALAQLVGVMPRAPAPNTRDELREMLTRFIFAVSAGHRMVGSLSWHFLTEPYLIPRRVYRGLTVAQSLPYREELEADVIAKWATAPRSFRLTDDWSHLALDERGRAAMRDFQGALRTVGETIDARNRTRAVAFPYLHPRELDSSTAT